MSLRLSSVFENGFLVAAFLYLARTKRRWKVRREGNISTSAQASDKLIREKTTYLHVLQMINLNLGEEGQREVVSFTEIAF